MPSLASLDAQPDCWHNKMPCMLLPVLAALCCLLCSLGSTGRQQAAHSVKLCVFTLCPSRVCVFLSLMRPVAMQPPTLGACGLSGAA